MSSLSCAGLYQQQEALRGEDGLFWQEKTSDSGEIMFLFLRNIGEGRDFTVMIRHYAYFNFACVVSKALILQL